MLNNTCRYFIKKLFINNSRKFTNTIKFSFIDRDDTVK